MAANDPGQPPAGTRPLTVDLDTPRSALAIGAHPDDVEFGAGATLAKWAAGGCVVHHLICTDGSKGTWDAGADIPALVLARRREQAAAARVVAGDRSGGVHFLGYVDGELGSGLGARAAVATVIRRLRPAVVLGHDPWRRYRLHPDHRNAGLLTCDGVVAARDPFFFPGQGLAPHRPDALLLWEADVPNHAEDVSGYVDSKLAALAAHESQFESTMHAADEAGLRAFGDRIRRRLAEHGAPHGLAAAEVFHLIRDL